MRLQLLTSILIFTVSMSPLRAGETSLLIFGGEAVHLATKDKFHVVYNDLVTGGCLPRPARLKEKLETTLSQQGFEITAEKRESGNQITINALGYRYGSSTCLVHISAELEYFAATTVPYANTVAEGNSTFAPILHKIGSTFLTGSKPTMQGRLEKEASDLGAALALDISKARDVTTKHFPQIIEEYERVLQLSKPDKQPDDV